MSLEHFWWIGRDEARHLYINLELKAQDLPPIPSNDRDKIRTLFAIAPYLNINAAFDRLAPENQIKLGNAVHRYRKGLKDAEDAETHDQYAARYRGATDDQGDLDEWRPRFEYFESRKTEFLAAARAIMKAARGLLTILTRLRLGADDAAIIVLVNSTIDIWSGRVLELVNEVNQLPQQKAAATARRATFVQQTADVDMPDILDDGLDIDTDVPSAPNARPATDGGSWWGRERLGKGGFGVADLWVYADRQGNIKRRIVRKTWDLRGTWQLDHHWTNGRPKMDGNNSSTVPMEIQLSMDLADKPGSDAVVKHIHHKVDYANQSAEMYMEYCPHGDMDVAIRGRYGASRQGNRLRLGNTYNDFSPLIDQVPEPFIWSTFLSLVTAGILMERGSLDKRTADPNWDCIVHRDIKTNNVFLGPIGDEPFPVYPQAKLADFGMAIRIPVPDSRNPQDLEYEGTTGHATPEMHGKLRNTSDGANANQKARQSTKTNVWGVGIVLYSMMAGTYGVAGSHTPDGRNWFRWNILERREPPAFDQSAITFYSEELRNLVMACMRYDVVDRPEFDFLMNEVRRHTGDGVDGDDKAFGMRDMDKATGDAWVRRNPELNFLLEKKDYYAVGKTLSQIGWAPHDNGWLLHAGAELIRQARIPAALRPL